MKTLPKENGPNAPFSNEIIDLLNALNLEETSTLFRLIATHAWIKGAEKASNKQQAKLTEATHMIKILREEIEALKKELALQRLSDIGQDIEQEPFDFAYSLKPLYTSLNEDRDSAIYATGYWKGIDYKRMRELTDEEIDEVWAETCSDFKLIENGKTRGIINIYDVSRAILKKASEK